MKWTELEIPDQKDRTVIITGSSSGIGFQAAEVLASKNAQVIIAVRNIAKGNNAKEKILTKFPNSKIAVMKLDLADLSSIDDFSKNIKSKFDKLNLLINNAGVMIPPYSKTKDGFELQFGTNHLGHFALTEKLLALLHRTPGSRIVNVSSSAHKYGHINFDDLTWEKRKYKAWQAYGDSKIANLYFTYELQRKLSKSGSHIKVTAAHPGWTATDLQRHNGLFEFLNPFFAMKVQQGTLPTLRAAFDQQIQGGEFFGPDGWMEWKGFPIEVSSNQLSHDKDIAKILWVVSEETTGIKYNL